MKLLCVNSLELHTFNGQKPVFAILSHRWLPKLNGKDQEVLFADIPTGLKAMTIESQLKAGLRKVLLAVQQARQHGIPYIWIDTCCIDRDDAQGYPAAINNMYHWYTSARVCYAYLEDVGGESDGEFEDSVWFERGWTLQELVAPVQVVFYDQQWERIGTRLELCRRISQITGIHQAALDGSKQVKQFSIAQRMSWAARRRTTVPEDRAYCLLGLFDIRLTLIRGGNDAKVKAFRQLQEAICQHNGNSQIRNDHSIFAWQASGSGLFAKSPRAFANSGNIVAMPRRITAGDHSFNFQYRLDHVEITVPVLDLKPSHPLSDEHGATHMAVIKCCYEGDIQQLPLLVLRRDRTDSLGPDTYHVISGHDRLAHASIGSTIMMKARERQIKILSKNQPQSDNLEVELQCRERTNLKVVQWYPKQSWRPGLPRHVRGKPNSARLHYMPPTSDLSPQIIGLRVQDHAGRIADLVMSYQHSERFLQLLWLERGNHGESLATVCNDNDGTDSDEGSEHDSNSDNSDNDNEDDDDNDSEGNDGNSEESADEQYLSLQLGGGLILDAEVEDDIVRISLDILAEAPERVRRIRNRDMFLTGAVLVGGLTAALAARKAVKVVRKGKSKLRDIRNRR